MDTLIGAVAIIILISIPALLGLVYLELRQRRLFGPHDIIQTPTNNDTAAIAMSLQAELERLRAEIHGSLNAVSTDLERVRDQLAVTATVQSRPAEPVKIAEPERIDPDRLAAINELYDGLSALDTAFLAVSRPMLLPGEPFDPEQDLPIEAFTWECWNDVGSAAYAFADAFAKRRIRLDPATRDQLNTIISNIRRSLTTRLYPALTDIDGGIPEANRMQVVGLVAALAAEIAGARTILEQATVPRSV